VQQFEMADDLGDSDPATPQYGGYAIPASYRPAGAIWPAAGSQVNIAVYADTPQQIDLLVQGPAGAPAVGPFPSGPATSTVPYPASFPVIVEGRHSVSARLSNPGSPPARLYVKIDYLGPATSAVF
jgi:alpha-amylase